MKNFVKKYKTFPIQMKASFWFFICLFFQKGVSVISTPIFTRLFSVSEYGKFNVFNSWLGIISIIITLDLYAGVYTRGLIVFKEERNIFSSSLQGLTLVLCVVWTLLYVFFRTFWNSLFSLNTTQMLSMLLIIWTTAVFNFWSNEQRVLYKYKSIVGITLFVSIAKPILGIFLVLCFEDKVTARILGIVVINVIGYAWMFVYQMAHGKVFFSKKYWQHALCFNIPLIPHYLSQTVLNSADRIMIQNMISSHLAGIYSLAYSLSSIMTIFNISLMQTLGPWMYAKIRDNKSQDIAPIAYQTLIIVAGANIVLIAFAPEAVSIFAPKEYYDAIWCIPPIAMSVFFMYCYDLFAKFEFFYQKTRLIAITTVLGAILNIIMNFICIKIFGYIAAAYTTLVCYMCYAGFHFYAMNKVCKTEMNGNLPYSLKKILVVTVIFLIAGFCYLLTYNNIFARYSLTVILLIFFYYKRKKIKSLIRELIYIKKS